MSVKSCGYAYRNDVVTELYRSLVTGNPVIQNTQSVLHFYKTASSAVPAGLLFLLENLLSGSMLLFPCQWQVKYDVRVSNVRAQFSARLLFKANQSVACH